MGIKNLNRIVKSYPVKDADVHAKYIIVDGSNLVITFIQAFMPGTRANPIGETIIEIARQIVDNVSKRVAGVLNHLKKQYNCDTIYFIVDPCEQRSLELGDVRIDLKSSEHEKRALQQERQQEKLLKQIIADTSCKYQIELVADADATDIDMAADEDVDEDEAINFSRDIPEGTQSALEELERRFFELGSNFHYLLKPIYDTVCKMFKFDASNDNEKALNKASAKKFDTPDQVPEKMTTIDDSSVGMFNLYVSDYESDYTIANLANNLQESIIVSLDTDFFVMCCESETVYIYDFQKSMLYSPRFEWEIALGSIGINFNKKLIYRFAPLFGNDYTAYKSDKQHILDASDENTLECVLYKDVKPSARKKKLNQFKSLIEYSTDVAQLDELDKAVKTYSLQHDKYKDYNDKYMCSVLAYENMEKFFSYSKYRVIGDPLQKIRELFPNPVRFETNEYNDILMMY